MITIGTKVRVKSPFNAALPDIYTIEGQNPETGAWQINGGVDFSEEHLEVIE